MSDNSIAARMKRYAEYPLMDMQEHVGYWREQALERGDHLSVTCYDRVLDDILSQQEQLAESYEKWDATEKEDV